VPVASRKLECRVVCEDDHAGRRAGVLRLQQIPDAIEVLHPRMPFAVQILDRRANGRRRMAEEVEDAVNLVV
jgi:SpoU rRNA methylase family enzyme